MGSRAGGSVSAVRHQLPLSISGAHAVPSSRAAICCFLKGLATHCKMRTGGPQRTCCLHSAAQVRSCKDGSVCGDHMCTPALHCSHSKCFYTESCPGSGTLHMWTVAVHNGGRKESRRGGRNALVSWLGGLEISLALPLGLDHSGQVIAHRPNVLIWK